MSNPVRVEHGTKDAARRQSAPHPHQAVRPCRPSRSRSSRAAPAHRGSTTPDVSKTRGSPCRTTAPIPVDPQRLWIREHRASGMRVELFGEHARAKSTARVPSIVVAHPRESTRRPVLAPAPISTTSLHVGTMPRRCSCRDSNATRPSLPLRSRAPIVLAIVARSVVEASAGRSRRWRLRRGSGSVASRRCDALLHSVMPNTVRGEAAVTGVRAPDSSRRLPFNRATGPLVLNAVTATAAPAAACPSSSAAAPFALTAARSLSRSLSSQLAAFHSYHRASRLDARPVSA